MSSLMTMVHDATHHLVALDPYNPGQGKAPPGSVTQKLQKVMDWVAWIVTSICVVGVMIVAGRMALLHRRGEGGEHAAGLAWVAAACILVGSASAIVGSLV
jgi:hypothetical protein